MLKKDLAAALELSASMVSRLARQGMPTDSISAAKRWRETHLATGRRKEYRAPPFRQNREAPATAPQPQPQPQPAEDGGSFSSWRTRRERAAALQAEADLAEQRGRLIDVQELRDVFGRWLSQAKDIALSVGSRLGPVLAAESDQRAVEQAIDAEMNRMLAALAGADDDLAARQGAHDAS